MDPIQICSNVERISHYQPNHVQKEIGLVSRRHLGQVDPHEMGAPRLLGISLEGKDGLLLVGANRRLDRSESPKYLALTGPVSTTLAATSTGLDDA